MIFLIIFAINIILGYVVFGDQFRKKPIFNYDTSIESFGSMVVSVVLYFFISSVCLIFLTERIDIFLLGLINCSYKEEIINSGLSYVFCMILIGFLIHALYYVLYLLIKKLEKKYNKKYIAEIDNNEKTLILIVSCISLITVAIVNENDYEMAFFIIALILGKFFWVDNNFMNLCSALHKIKLKIFVIIISYWILSVYVSTMFGDDAILLNIISMTVGFILGMFLYIFINHKRNI